MKKSIKTLIIILGSLFVMILVVCFLFVNILMNPSKLEPNEGVWYCDELGIQACFDSNELYDTYIIIDGSPVLCEIAGDGNKEFEIVCIDSRYNLGYIPTVFYSAESVSVDDERFVTRECKTGTEYVFTRIG